MTVDLREENTPSCHVISTLQRLSILLNRDKVSLSLERLLNIRLLSQHEPARLVADIRQLPPPRKRLRVSLIAMRLLGMGPMALTERKHSRDLVLRDIVHKTANRARLLEPVALPQLARSNALVRAGLVVDAAGHWSAMDGVHNTVFGEEPHFVAPFFRITLFVLGVVVVD